MFNHNNYRFSELSDKFDVTDFDCGIESLNAFIKKHALINQSNNLSQTRVLHVVNENIVIGYHALCSYSIQKIAFPQDYTSGFPNYPIPCILLAQMAVDKKFHRSGMGKFVLFDALKKSKQLSREMGINAVIVDAFNEEVIPFYEKYGFQRFKNYPRKLYLTISQIPD